MKELNVNYVGLCFMKTMTKKFIVLWGFFFCFVSEKITLPTLEDFDDLPPPPPPEELLCNDLANLTFTSSSPLLTRTSVPSHPHHRCLPPVAGEVDSLQNYHHKIIHLLQLFEETQVLANLQRLEKEIYATYNPCCGDRRYKGHLASDIVRFLFTKSLIEERCYFLLHLFIVRPKVLIKYWYFKPREKFLVNSTFH